MKKLSFILALILASAVSAQVLNKQEIKEYGLTTKATKASEISRLIVKNLTEGDFESVTQYYNSKLKEKLSADRLKSTWARMTSNYGEFKGMLEPKVKQTAEHVYYLMGMEFEKQKFDLQFTFTDSNQLNSFRLLPFTHPNQWEAPSYVDQTSIETKKIKVGAAKPLIGEFVFPKNQEHYPIVVFVHGSGANDMDASLGPNKIFKDLAYGLASHGIGSIRYNKRTFDYSASINNNKITIDKEVTDDAVTAIQQAKNYNKGKVFLAGHSLGGHIAPKIADQEFVNGVILLAGNSSSMVDLIIPQFEYLMENDSTTAISQFQMNAMKFQIKNYREDNFDSTTIGPILPFGLSGVYWLSYKGYDPIKIAKKQQQPYLILNGERDYQVTPEEARKWNNGNKHKLSNTIIYPKLNHLFYAGEGLLLPAEYEIESHFDEKVLTDIVEFILQVEKE